MYTNSPGGNGVTFSRADYTTFHMNDVYDPAVANLVFSSARDGWATKWGGGFGTGVALTFSWGGGGSYNYLGAPMPSGISSFSLAQSNWAWTVMQKAAAITRITVTWDWTDTSTHAGDIRWANASVSTAQTMGPPGDRGSAGDIFIGYGIASMTPTAGSYAGFTYIHELGHALGLFHPHETLVAADPVKDQLKYTVMSYRDFAGDSTTVLNSEYFPTSFMLDDILALQYLYGANTGYNGGNNWYSWGSSDHVYETIWDGGGIDTIDASSQQQGVVLNLNPGVWSQIGVSFFNGQSNVRDCLTIAYGTVIENATGSSHDDTLVGNWAGNRLDGGLGNDTMQGGYGDDTYVVDSAGDNAIEQPGEGIDTVVSAIGYTLGADFENLTLSGSTAVNGTGNALDNTLTGNSAANVLDGAGGNDTYLTAAGGGNDEVVDGSGTDRVVFAGIASTQVSVGREGGEVVIRIGGYDGVRFADGGGAYPVEQFEFSDGVRDASWIDAMLAAAASGADTKLTIAEDSSYAVRVGDFGFASGDETDSLGGVRVDTISGAGILSLGGVQVVAGQVVTAADVAAGLLVFAPAANGNGAGYANFTFSVQDQDGDFDASPNRVTFDVTAVNDVPTGADKTVTVNEDTSYAFAVSDFGFSDTDVGDSLQGVRIDTLPNAGNLFLSGYIVTAGQWVWASDIAAGKLVLGAVQNAYGSPFSSFTFSVNDGHGAYAATPSRITLNVTPVNDPPSSADKTVVLAEDSSYAVAIGDFGFADVDQGDGLGGVLIYTLPAAGSLKLNGVNVTAGQVVAPAEIAAGGLVFTPALNGSGSTYASLQFRVQDQNGATQFNTNKLTFNVTPVNDPPSATDKTIAINEDQKYAVAYADFGFADIDSGIASVRIETLPGAGTLKLNDLAVTAGQLILISDITAGKLVFAGDANAFGMAYTDFTFTAKDSAGAFALVSNRMTFNVTSVADAPTGADRTITLNEDGSYALSVADFGFADADPGDSMVGAFINSLPAAGTLKNNGTSVTGGQFIAVADIAAGKLVFAPALNGNGATYATVQFQVRDQTGSTDPAPNKFTFSVTPVNDAPNGADKTLTILEDASYTVTAADFGFTDLDAGDSMSNVRIETVPAAGLLKLGEVVVSAGQIVSAADIASGNLVFRSVANANGTGYGNFTFFVQDQAGVFDAAFNRVTFNVTPVNDAPSGADKTVVMVEDGSYTIVAADFGFTDADTGDVFTNVRIDVLPVAGTLKVATVPVTVGQVITAADIAANKLVFTPAANGNGNGYASLSFSVKDNFGAFDLNENQLTFNVTAVNDAPSGTDKTVTILEDAAYAVTVADLGFTDPDSGDTLCGVRIDMLPAAGTLRLNGTAVTAGQLIVAADLSAGNLLFTPAANANGMGYANFTFLVQDQASAFDGTFNRVTFDVTPVNDAPVGADKTVTLIEDATYTVTAADFGFADADAGDSFGGVRINVLPAAGTLKLAGVAVTAGQTVSYADIAANKLVFAAALNGSGNGYAGFGFSVQDSVGAFDTIPNQLTFNVTPVNDAPGGADKTLTINEDAAYVFAAADFGFTDPDAGDALAGVRIEALPAAGTLRLNGGGVNAGQLISASSIASGGLVFTPAANASGTGYASFTFFVKDQAGAFDAASNRLTVNVAPVNDAPTGNVAVSGSAVIGQVLAATNSLADADGLGTLQFQWLRSGSAVAGATSSTYTLAQADVGSTMSVSISYVDGGGTAESATSAATATVTVAPPNGSGSITINGNKTQGQVLTGSASLSDPDGLGTLNYQWLRNGSAIADATGTTYTLLQADVGSRISLQVSYIDGRGTAESRISSQTSTISNVNDLPTGTANIVGKGLPKEVLTCDSSSIADADGLGAFTYQWTRNGGNISGATGTTYTLVSADEGAAITVKVKYTDGFGKNETVTSATLTIGKTFTGSSGNDTINGTVGADSIDGGNGNDTLTGGHGDDAVKGGSGIDVLVVAATRSASVANIIDANTLAATVTGDGTDSINGVERIKYTDTALAIDINGNAGMAAKVVGALLGAVHIQDRDLMGSILDQADTGMTEQQLAAYVASTALFASLAGSHGNADFVTQVFECVYLRAPTAAELATYTQALDSGASTQGSLGASLAESSENLVNIGLVGLQSTGLAYTF